MLRRMTPSSAQLTGGDLSVDILHTEDSVALGDGTNLIGTFASVEGVRSLPVQVKGVAKTKLTDSLETDFAEIEDVGGEKALKVSVIASVGGGGGGTAATDSAAFTATATQGTPIMGARDDTASDTLAEGEMGIIRATTDRALHVAVQNSSLAVTGTFWQATQPVSIASMPATPVTDNGGSLTVDGTVSVTGVSTLAEQQTQSATLSAIKTSTELIDDTIFTDDAAFTAGTSKVQAIGAMFDDTATDSVDENDIGILRMTADRLLKIQLAGVLSGVAVPITDNSGSLTVDGTVAATQSGTWNIGSITTLPSIPAGTNNIGDVDVLTLPSLPTGSNVIGAVTQSGTWNVGTVTTLTSITNAVTVAQSTASSLKAEVVGSAAHDNGSPGVPIMVSGRAKSANPTAVADGDVSYINTDLAGRVVTQPFAPRELVNVQSTTITSSVAETTVVTSAASTFHDICLLVITNKSSTGSIATLKDSTGGTTRGIFYVPATGGIVIPYPVPLAQASSGQNWTITGGTSVDSLYVHVEYVKRA